MKHGVVKAALVACALAGGITGAAAFPDRPVRLIVPFPPGGVTDTAARLVGQHLSTKWGQQVVIDNRPGAGGVIGVDAAARSAPDGYTMLLATNGEITINPAIIAKLRYDSQKDLIPIAMVTNTPFLWSTNVSTPINSLPELVAAAKAKPGELAYSSAGIGSSSHLATEQFAAATGIKLLHVPYRGGAPAATALVSGDVPVSAIALSSVMPVIDTGKIRLLAVTSDKRMSLLPNVPTVMETGVLKDFQSSIWTGLFVPAGTPEPIVAKIEQDLIEVLKDPVVVARLEQVGASAVGMPGAQLRGHIQKEIDELKKLAADANIKLD
jgi:tripartite-type tricarboxylate transporter receptor subunit TctC